MKNMYMLFCLCLIISCSNVPEVVESEIGYIDYLSYPEDKLMPEDIIMLESVDFQGGKLSSSLDAKSALELGIPEVKYNYFLEFLQNENQKFEKYLNAGAVVFYNGKPFARNEKVLQYIEESEPLSRARYDDQIPLYAKEFVMSYGALPKDVVHFIGPSKISVSIAGQGSFTIIEKGKDLTAYLENTGGVTSATFKWGFGNDVNWSWEVFYYASTAGIKSNIFFTGYVEKPMPDENPSDPEYVYFWKNIPGYIHLLKYVPEQSLYVSVDIPGTFTVRLYKRSLRTYDLYAQQDFDGNYGARLMYPLECTFWVVIYRKLIRNNKVTYEYLGDAKYPYPPYPYQRE